MRTQSNINVGDFFANQGTKVKIFNWVLKGEGGGRREEFTFGRGIFLDGGGMTKFFSGGGRTPPPPPIHSHSPSRGNFDLHSSLKFFLISRQLVYHVFILDIKFRFANIKWDLYQNNVNMTNPVDKICANIQTSSGYYLLNWVLASMCSCGQ